MLLLLCLLCNKLDLILGRTVVCVTIYPTTEDKCDFAQHRPDSIQGTDYIANYFLNLRVSGAKIENLK